MTETRAVYQVNMFGGEVVAGDVPARVQLILEKYPLARDDYAVMFAQYYWEYTDVAGRWLGTREQWVDWWRRVDSPKTLQNRCGEVQNAHPELEREEVRRRRAVQAKQGRVR